LLSDFIDPSFFSSLLVRLLIRKKFLSFCGNGLWPLECLLEDIEMPEKARFSLGVEEDGVEVGDEPWKSAVIEGIRSSVNNSCNAEVDEWLQSKGGGRRCRMELEMGGNREWRMENGRSSVSLPQVLECIGEYRRSSV
jgi:hypothetical protein